MSSVVPRSPCISGFLLYQAYWRERERRSGESTRLPPVWPGFKSLRRRHMWVEFADGSLPCSERFFSGYSAFPLSSTTNTSKFQFETERTDTFLRVLKNSLVLRLVDKKIINKNLQLFTIRKSALILLAGLSVLFKSIQSKYVSKIQVK